MQLKTAGYWLHTDILPETLIENMTIATENALIVHDT